MYSPEKMSGGGVRCGSLMHKLMLVLAPNPYIVQLIARTVSSAHPLLESLMKFVIFSPINLLSLSIKGKPSFKIIGPKH